MTAASIVAGWEVANGRNGANALEEYLVLRLRQWRPDNVITQGIDPTTDEPLSHIVNQVVQTAVRQAADPKFYPHQVRVMGLAPWQVKKVFATSSEAGLSTIELETSHLATRLGRSIRDHALAQWSERKR